MLLDLPVRTIYTGDKSHSIDFRGSSGLNGKKKPGFSIPNGIER